MTERAALTERRVSEILRDDGFRVSVELVPMMVDREGSPSLAQVMAVIAPWVSFVSVTQGAGGSARELSGDMLRALGKYGVSRCAHLVCGYAARADVLRQAAEFYADGVRNFLVLKGDRPRSGGAFANGSRGEFAPEGDYRFASECIRDLRALYPDACIGAAAYPDQPEELEHLRLKRADFAITQMCFSASSYSALASDVEIPVIPGTCVLRSREQAEHYARRFRVTVPSDPPELRQLIDEFKKAGAPGAHLFLLGDLDRVAAMSPLGCSTALS